MKTIAEEPPASSELSGYLELGMKAEAEDLARHYLAAPRPGAARFNEALDAVVVSNNPARWQPQVESAYDRLAPAERGTVRVKMLSFYWSLGEGPAAARFLSPPTCRDPAELLMSMNVLLNLDRIEEARGLARRCERRLKIHATEFEQGLLRDALGAFYSRTGQPLRALEHWQEVPAGSPSLRTALLNVVELCLWPALSAVEQGLDVVARKKRAPDLSVEIQQPGLEQALTAEIERDLLRLKRKLEQIVPPARQRELGMEQKGGNCFKRPALPRS